MYQKKQTIFLILVLLVLIKKYSSREQIYTHNQQKEQRFHVAEFNFDHVSDVYAITLWILLGSLAKVGQYRSIS